MGVTIKEVAKLAGVSKATVSRVLNNTKPVSTEIKEKVMKVIEETGYKPSSLARSLVNKETHLIGVLIPDISNDFYSVLVKGMVHFIDDNNYNILLGNSFDEPKKELDYLELFQSKEVDGIIFMTRSLGEKHLEYVDRFNKPIITVNRKLDRLGIPNIDIDNFKAAYDATKYLIDLNHKRIGIVRASLDDPTAGVERFEGYKKALEDNSIEFKEELVKESHFNPKEAKKVTEELLGLKEPPTAIFAVSDIMATGVIKAIVEKGLKVPENISVFGFDDIPLADNFIPSISTIRQPIYEMGEKAMDLLLRMISGEDITEKTFVLDHQIVERQSTRKLC